MPTAGAAPASTPSATSKPGSATSKPASTAGPRASKPARVGDKSLRITPGYRDGRATFRLAGRPATRYTLALSGQGAAAPAAASLTVLSDRSGVATASVPVRLTGDRVGGILADISSAVAGQQRVTSSSVWLHPGRTGAEVVGQSATDAQLKAIGNDAAGRKAALKKLATASGAERSVTTNTQAAVADDRIEVHGTARWTDWAGVTHPVRHINVQLKTLDMFSYGAQTTTDDNGDYSFDIPALNVYTDVQVTFQAQNAAGQVGLDGLSTACSFCFGPYFKTVSADHLGGGSSTRVDMTAGVTGPWGVSFAIVDSLWTAYLFGAQASGSAADSITVYYPEQNGGNDTDAFTTPGEHKMTLGDREWSSWDVINHEYGHWFDSQHDITPLTGGEHCVDANLATAVCPNKAGRGKDDGTALAWSEGFADFYSISAAHYGPLPHGLPVNVGDGHYNDVRIPSTGGSDNGFYAASDLSEPGSYYGEDNEFAIAGTLFNLMDPDPSGSVYTEQTGIGVSLLYSELIAAHADRFSDVVDHLWPSDTTSTLQGTNQTDFSCMMSAARIAPYWGSDYAPTSPSPPTASLSQPPALEWHAGNGGNFANDNFVVQALDSDGLPYYTSPGQTSTHWTPDRAAWDAMTRGRGGAITLRVLGANSAAPYTGFYRGCPVAVTLNSSAVVNRSDCTAVTLPANDDGSTGAVNLPFPVNYYGTTHTYLYVNNNGNVTFNAPLGTFTPFAITASTTAMIAPFFADVDTRGTASAPVTYSYGTTSYAGHQAFCVNWLNVGYYASHTDKLNSFQLLLVDRQDRGAGDFDIVFDYDSIQWETGDASGGSGGFGGIPAAVGFSAGTGDSSQFFQLPGSLQSHQLTDGDPHALATGSIGALGTPGRYVFPVSNGQAPNSTTGVRGAVTSAGFAVPDAPVQVCPHGGGACAFQTRTGTDGTYNALGLPAGTYDVKAFPPPGLTANPATSSAVVVAEGQAVTVDLALNGLAGVPPGTSIGPVVGGGSPGPSVPVVNWHDQLALSTTGCPGGTATYEVLSLESGSLGTSWTTGSVPETSPGHYATTVAPLSPHQGYAEVDVFLDCPAGTADQTVTFDVYVDPSGTVLDQDGQPVPGATVTLLRSDSAAGPFAAVPTGSDLMSPASRTNPVLTGSDGRFGWDVVGGYYRVTASKAGCSAADGSATATSGVYSVPPPVTGIQLVLTCVVPDTTPPQLGVTPVSLEGNTTGGYTGSLPGVTATDPSGPVTLTNDAPAVLPLGTSTVTWTGVDAVGNRSTATQAVEVVDTTAPVLTCPAAVVGRYPASPVLGNPGVQDVVDAAPVVGNNAPASFPAGGTTVSWSATDHSGNRSTCTQQVTLTPGWTVQPTVALAGAPSFGGVACPSVTSCFAVGWTATGALVEHWDGGSWSVQATPGSSGAQLLGVSCSAADACTAVGTDTSTEVVLIERWNGTGWSEQSLPRYVTQLGSVSCPSATSCTAVGYQLSGRVNTAVAASFNGSSWSVTLLPTVAQLLAVSCSAGNACTAVGGDPSSGTALIERWDGTSWSSQSLPDPVNELGSVSCASATSCVAVGYQRTGRSVLQVAASWDGVGWSVQVLPNLPQLASVSCSAPGACTAVGGDSSSGTALIERWDGTSWSSQSLPDPVNELESVSCASATSCMAVGYQRTGRSVTQVAASWDGTS